MGNKKDASKELIWGKRKNRTWIYIVAAVVVVIAGIGGYILFGPTDTSEPASTATTTGQDALVRRAIDGVYVPADQATYFPVAVMVENLSIVRPQSGLTEAGVVYEALAEGGITRFLAVYGGSTPGEIGPVRSARPYFIDWTLEYGALYAHAGGSPQALADISTYEVFDLNQFYNSQYFWRKQDLPLASEHTLFTSGELMQYALRDTGAEEASSFTRWTFKDDADLADRPVEVKAISIDYSSFSYKVEYQYDRETNTYIRSQGGAVHADLNGTTIQPKNIIVQKVATHLADAERLSMETVGEGEAIIFRDGVAIDATWKKEDKDSRTLFYDLDGNEVAFNAGQTWVEVVPTDRTIEYN
ncbi:MAG: DUF3048 domain-containing protein [Patescibacteria group bacterium]